MSYNLETIKIKLRNRIEINNVTVNTIEEKVEKSKQHLFPKQLEEHGLKTKDLKINDTSLEFIIEVYTRESGVRNLERQIAKVIRHFAIKVTSDEKYEKSVNKEVVEEI